MKRRFTEWLSLYVAKNPGKVILLGIFVFNIIFVMIASVIISGLSLKGTETMNLFEAAFCTITMILDAGCIQFVIEDIGQSGVVITLICLVIIFVGMISFTGAIIGYITNYISDFIGNANAGNRRLKLSNHIVILNWNNRASEIINDLMYCDTREKIVVLVKGHKEEIESEINERLTDTVIRENEELNSMYGASVKFARNYSQKVTVVVREGDVFSSKQLRDISLEKAKTVIILGDEYKHDICSYRNIDKAEELQKGNSQTIKTLMQVADITSAKTSADNQRVVVEISDEWTWQLVRKIIEYKQIEGKCNIVPVRVNKVLGQLLSQFSIMPELNIVYRELLSNKGMTFCYKEIGMEENPDILAELKTHTYALPLTTDIYNGKKYLYYAAGNEQNINKTADYIPTGFKVAFNEAYIMEHKHVIILGHNGKIADIMEGFESFVTEWQIDGGDDILNILVIDDEKNLEKMDYYKAYPFVTETVAASIYDRELICDTIEDFVVKYAEDTSILILSDDLVPPDEVDAQALANLVYVQDIIKKKKAKDSDFDEKSMDIIVEIIDPKHHDIVSNYSVNNVVISNRFISKMITQIGEKDALFDFYTDILTFDTDVLNGYDSMELYIKRADRLFKTLPGKCSAHELVCALYEASTASNLHKDRRNPTVILGMIDKDGRMVLFIGNLKDIEVELSPQDLLIVYSAH